MTLAARRAAIVAAVVAVMVAAGLIDANVGRGAPAVPVAATSATATAVLPPGPGSSAWFCAGGSGAGAQAEETVVITNPTGQVATGTVTAVPSAGAARSADVDVAPGAVVSTVPAQLAPGPWVSAVVLLDQPGVAVAETVATPIGWSEAPCASSTATRWLFTGASTAGNDGVNLSVLNPSVTPAVVDTTLVTSAGQALEPAAYQGVTVPADSLVTEYLSDHDENDPSMSAVVTAVSGSVVVASLQSFTAAGAQGVALQLGVPRPSTTWAFPTTEEIPDGQVTFHLYDPGPRAARVRMALGFSQGGSSPVDVTVPAGQSTTIRTSAQSEVPVGTPFAATFDSSAGIVVTRDVQAPPGGGGPQRGATVGSGVGARQWVLPPVTGPGTSLWSFAVEDLSARPVSVSVSAVSSGGAPVGVAGLSPVTVAPGHAVVSSGAPRLGSMPVVVTASGPVAVELDPEPVGSPGVVDVAAFPVG